MESHGNQYCKDEIRQKDPLKSSVSLSSLERRRKIYEKSEERMKKILGLSARYVDEDDLPCCYATETMKNDFISKVEVREPSFKNSYDVSCDSNRWPALIMLSVIILKIISILESYEVIASPYTFSFIIPFLILEWFYLLSKSYSPMKTNWSFELISKSMKGFHKIKFYNISDVIICRVLPILDDIALHFSIYFVSLCFLHLF